MNTRATLFLFSGLLTTFSLTQTTSAEPPFKSKQVVVEGEPDTLMGYDIVRYLPHANLTIIAVEPGQELAEINRLRTIGRKANFNVIAQKFATVDDPYYSPYQWHLSSVQSELAWDLTTGSGATVAVLDTGLALGGKDGIGCVLSGYDMVNDDADPHDGDGHGTHVAGTIAAHTNNAIGVAGLAYDACIMPIKVLDDTGRGGFAEIADGLIFAVNNGADVINMSLGISARYKIFNDPVLDPALDYAYANDVTVVCAAGNDGNRKNVSYPASYLTTIAVGATDYENNLVRYSNRGTGLDIMAPGGDTSVDLNGDGYGDGVLQETFIDGSWGYYFYQGTSMASPHVAAVVALLISYETASTPDDIYSALTSTSLDLGDSGYDSTFGWGLVQAYDALTNDTGCVPSETTEVSCDDGLDNDCDGVTDLDDSDCDSCTPTEAAEESCDDGVDNDCDGFVDLSDSDCQGEPCDLGQLGDPCSLDADCCSNKCKGKPGDKTCR